MDVATHRHSTCGPSAGADALGEQLKRHAEPLRAAIAPKIPARWRSVLSCDDVLQQTFLDAFLAAGRFVPRVEDSFARWLRRLAENNLIEAIRGLEADKRGGRARRVNGGRDDACTTLIERLVSARTQTTPSGAASRRESAGLLHDALSKLPPAYREVVTGYDLEGRSMADVAAALGRSPGATHLLRVRAHRRLGEILTEKMTHS